MTMLFRRPRITKAVEAPGMELLQDAFDQYGVAILAEEESRELRSLHMDDIDLIEAIQLVEKFVGAKVNRKALLPSTTIAQIARVIDETRTRR